MFMIHLYGLLYFGLYLIWPFNFARFWSPILPIMLAFAADALIQFTEPHRLLIRLSAPSFRAAIPLLLLFFLSAEEDFVQLNNYARRLNYVSGALEESSRIIMNRSPDPEHTIVGVMGGDEHFALAWYFRQQGDRGRAYTIRSPEPHLTSKGEKPETVEEMLLRSLREKEADGQLPRVFLVSYFTHHDARAVLANLHSAMAGKPEIPMATKLFQKEIIVEVWLLSWGKPPPASLPQAAVNSDDTARSSSFSRP
jgi:hypothetical protein